MDKNSKTVNIVYLFAQAQQNFIQRWQWDIQREERKTKSEVGKENPEVGI